MLLVPFRDFTIRWKMMWMSMLASGAALLLACMAFIAFDLVTFRDTTARNLSTLAEIVGINSASALLFSDPRAAGETLTALRAKPTIFSAGIYTKDGRLFAVYSRKGVADAALPERLEEKGDGYRFDKGGLTLFRRILSEKERIGMVYIQSDLKEITARLKLYGGIVLGVLLVSFVVALAISSSMERKISQPIRNLAQTAKMVSSQKDYSVRAIAQSRDEVGLLVDAFNQMLSQIQQRGQALQEAHDQLEHRVEERTRALGEEVSERRRGEEQIRLLNVELERRIVDLNALNKELESFSYSVSHDLRAPLRSIDGFSQALLEDYSDKLDDEGKANLRRVREASQRMAQLIDDMLNLSKVTRTPLRREQVDLSGLAHMIVKELQKTEPERQVSFRVEEGVIAEGDPQLLSVALGNLLNNAWKYTGRHPEAHIEFGQTTRNGAMVYFVRDDGAGFDMTYKNKLFGVFQRLHAATAFPGTGVGLATVQRIVTRHGGRIWAEGAVERGATFYFTLQPEQSATST